MERTLRDTWINLKNEILEAIVSVLGIKTLQNATNDVKDVQKIFTEDHRRKVNKSTKDK